ncbi:LINE-1 retrotransposable element ORF2 protein [Bienertia sinuspersici]
MEKQATETFRGATKSYNSWLKQKAKIHWLQEGDTNSKIFFNSLRVRTCRNNINRVQNTHGIWVEDHDSITRAFTDFYTDLLQGSDHNRRLVIKDIVRMGSTLNNDHRSMLDCTFSDKEIKQAIFSIPSNKAPGLDGYNSCFFKEAWSVVGQDVIRAVREFFASGKLLKEVSVTTLTMVPKVQTPSNVGDYRPIACCSTIYKCISKLLCSKLRAILPDIISPNQGAFVTGRSIMHNALICQDMMRFYRPSQIQDCCMFKLDVKKAYDTVSWGFMNDIMTELGFPEHFIRLIMVCITSPQYTLMINGVPSPLVTPSRGLRQGDPLSPLLFTLCMEYFTRVMKKVSLLPGYRFHPLCRQLQLNHLCFADDILMFSRGDINTVTMNLAGLELFSQSTGLMISAAKSEFFCAGVDSNTIQRIKALSGFSLGRLPFTYLGIPMRPKQIHPSDCEKLTDKMCARIKMWSSRNLSYAGRLQLVNSVLMTISSYWCQIFVLPRKVIQGIIGVCRAFLWHGTYASHKMSLVAWDEVCKPKQEGGLGIRNIHIWNLAAVGKHVWAIANKEDNLWVRWVHTIYIRDQSWAGYRPTQICSWIWKLFCKIKDDLLEKQIDLHSHTYSIKQVYNSLTHTGGKVHWDKVVWNRAALPKHQFLMWLSIRGRLLTRDRLSRLGMSTETTCCLCQSGEETHLHLFFQCSFSRECLSRLMQWMDCRTQHNDLHQLVNWIGRNYKGSRLRRYLYGAVVSALAYRIWQARNDMLWNQNRTSADSIVREVQYVVKNRIQIVGRMSSLDKEWIDGL